MKFLEAIKDNWRYVKLISVPHYAGTLAIVLVIANLRYEHVNLVQCALLAVVLNPVVLAAVVVFLFVRRYDVSIRQDLALPGPKRYITRPYRRLGWVSWLQNRLGNLRLGASVPLGHQCLAMLLGLTKSRLNINADASVDNDLSREQLVQHFDLLQAIANLSASGSSTPDQRGKALETVGDLVRTPGWPSGVAAEMVRVTLNDGPGILSTVNGSLRIHYVLMLPDGERQPIIALFEGLKLPIDLYGWLAGRVLQVCVEAEIFDRRAMAADLPKWAEQTTASLRAAAGNKKALLEAKYEAREWLIKRTVSRV